MKCPKCAYLGFEEVERCRNCGYDFSLSGAPALPELAIRPGNETLRPLDDLSLIDGATEPLLTVPMSDAGPDIDRIFAASSPDPESFEPSRRDVIRSTGRSGELPLFGGRIAADDQPMITRASPPRQPLSVRRATPDVARIRSDQPRPQSFDLDLPESMGDIVSYTPAARAADGEWPPDRQDRAKTAALGTRLVAVAIDLLILLVVDVAVIYFTMQICGIGWGDAAILPKGPLLAFLLVQNGGYLVAFTAGGQTLGKMATGIRVIGTESAGALDLGRAFMRTVIWMVLAVPAGLGFLTLLSHDHRGLHDRFAGTRVVRASA